jgi:diguanylate cyclase (GGDEF)-like protein
MFKKKILIVDDTELMVKLITDILESADYQVVAAVNGVEGIQKVKEEKPDLVLLDIVMPGMDGFEVCKALRDDESNNLMPIIMLTAQDNEEDKLTGLDLGADDYIIKPFNYRELLSRVKNTLRRIDRNRWANPLTGLQGNLEIQAEINHRIATRQIFSVLYADLDNFKAYNDVYGFASGDRAIKLCADIITDNAHSFGTSKDFIGHIGGDDFVIITVPEKADAVCEGIIQDFDFKIRTLYTEQDRKKEFIFSCNRQGQCVKYPIMSISIAVVSNDQRDFISHLEVAEVTAEVKKKAKALNGSVYVKDRRKH